MELQRFEHPGFTSNTYVLTAAQSGKAFLIDIGEYAQTKKSLNSRTGIEALLLTHAHYDHIYHINELLQDYPNCQIYASAYTIEALRNPKLNLSFYHEDPVSYQGDRLISIKDNDKITLAKNMTAEVIATPGHTPGCLTYRIGQYLFTGDAFIPGYKVVTKLKGGDKEISAKSVELIKGMLSNGTLLCPGHGSTHRIEASNVFSKHL